MSQNQCTRKVAELQMVLDELVRQANEHSHFSQRNTALNAVRFVQVLSLGWLRKGDASLNELASMAQDLGCWVSGSALHERIDSTAVALLGEVFIEALRRAMPYPRIPIHALHVFTAIHVTDSTQMTLPRALSDALRGNHGDAKLKLHVTLDYLRGQWVAFDVVEGRCPDQKSELVIQQAIPGSLNLFDLGYFKQQGLQAIVQQGAYFVSRYQSQTAIYDPDSAQRIDLARYLQALKTDEVDIGVLLGVQVHLPVRLVARRLPLAVAQARRRKAKAKARKQGQTCRESYLQLLDWDILITNLSEAEWSATQIFDLYPIRMQVEWSFRIWKSQLRLDHIGNWRVERVLCQLNAHLIGILICHHLTAGWTWWKHTEYSFSKCVQLIQFSIAELMRCIRRRWYGTRTWMQRLHATFQQFAPKTKRKKQPSTFQILINWSLS